MELIQEQTIDCPYCGETISLLLDCSVADQEYTEDCQVCCQPIIVTLHVTLDGNPALSVRREDD
ncbi:MAG: CPXCG motif-containing cysteine-rich protein [Sedimenticola sp.]|uniref:CPXCG motif-containing cysteine-rich protein n=1 Tax=Sedimenticola thiotaurini TaxID=1543721 RepID=A0A558CT03_9GAMM|nr:CPXCG motif-containing cysteine-rich protein [Sedimenticola sp.]MCW8976400.1 CPXCG motif-containing cysteine-rich protein [Sedimenticola sp.]TVT51907.1 MAG: CPXCG motif-containing cysteine-rich protein [Sedimenticola thiotaurini]